MLERRSFMSGGKFFLACCTIYTLRKNWRVNTMNCAIPSSPIKPSHLWEKVFYLLNQFFSRAAWHRTTRTRSLLTPRCLSLLHGHHRCRWIFQQARAISWSDCSSCAGSLGGVVRSSTFPGNPLGSQYVIAAARLKAGGTLAQGSIRSRPSADVDIFREASLKELWSQERSIFDVVWWKRVGCLEECCRQRCRGSPAIRLHWSTSHHCQRRWRGELVKVSWTLKIAQSW